MSKIDLYAAIRRDARAGSSGRAIEAKYRVSRRTVGKALASVWPEPRKALPSRPSKLDGFKPVIEEILRADLDAPRKQRHTAKRIFDRLVAEYAMADVSYPVVRRYVRERAAQIRVETGRAPVEAFVPQTHRPGMEAEVDFGEAVVNLRGEHVTCMLFALRMSYSGKAVHRIFASGGQEAFLEGQIPHDHDQLELLLDICEEFFRRTSPATHPEIDTLLRRRGITGGPGWLIDMLGLTRLRLQRQASEPTINTHRGP